MSHPLLAFLLDAADGVYPEPDGGVTFLPVLDDGRAAVVSFTGHAVVAAAMTADDLVDLAPDGFGRAIDPAVLLRVAAGRPIGVLDVTLVGRGVGGGVLPSTTAWDDHSRVRYARGLRSSVAVHGDERGFVTLASGLAGRREMSIEIDESLHGSRTGRALVAEALALVPAGEPVFAAVSPGNARSLRAFLSQGFAPIGSEVIIG